MWSCKSRTSQWPISVIHLHIISPYDIHLASSDTARRNISVTLASSDSVTPPPQPYILPLSVSTDLPTMNDLCVSIGFYWHICPSAVWPVYQPNILIAMRTPRVLYEVKSRALIAFFKISFKKKIWFYENIRRPSSQNDRFKTRSVFHYYVIHFPIFNVILIQNFHTNAPSSQYPEKFVIKYLSELPYSEYSIEYITLRVPPSIEGSRQQAVGSRHATRVFGVGDRARARPVRVCPGAPAATDIPREIAPPAVSASAIPSRILLLVDPAFYTRDVASVPDHREQENWTWYSSNEYELMRTLHNFSNTSARRFTNNPTPFSYTTRTL